MFIINLLQTDVTFCVELTLSIARQLNLIVTDVAVSHEAMEYCHNNLEVHVSLTMSAAKQLNLIVVDMTVLRRLPH